MNFNLDLGNHPGRIFAVAALLPLLPVIVLAIAQMMRLRLGRVPGYLAIVAMLGAMACSLWGSWQLFHNAGHEDRWAETADWIRIGPAKPNTPAKALEIGYRIDALTALLFSMVTVVGTLIFVFALGYMNKTPLSPGGRGESMLLPASTSTSACSPPAC